MFGFIKNLLHKTESAPVRKPGAKMSPRLPVRPAAPTVSGPTLAQVRQTLARNQNGRGVKVPLQPILAGLPSSCNRGFSTRMLAP